MPQAKKLAGKSARARTPRPVRPAVENAKEQRTQFFNAAEQAARLAQRVGKSPSSSTKSLTAVLKKTNGAIREGYALLDQYNGLMAGRRGDAIWAHLERESALKAIVQLKQLRTTYKSILRNARKVA